MTVQTWPVDHYTEFTRRGWWADQLIKDTAAQAHVTQFYKDNPAIWINDWAVTYDPRNKSPLPKIMPFRLFKRQEEFVQFLWECVRDGENGLVEKARDMGASWTCCAFTVWLWLFHEGSAVGWGSRKEELVDKKGDNSAIFPKMRMIIDNLPQWMKPKGYNPVTHAAFMKLINPANGATAVGEAGDNIGRGGRTTVFFKDESAHYERPELIEAALGDNTDVQIDISSVNGTANVFYNRRMAGEVWYPGHKIAKGITRVFIMDWRDHPGKTQEWYDRRRARAEREALLHIFKQEVDRDYAGMVQGVILPPEWVKACINSHLVINQKWDWGIKITGLKAAFQDVADEGGDKNALVARHGILCNYADQWAGDPGEAAERAAPICSTLIGVRELYYDSIGVGAGFKVGVNAMKKAETWPERVMVFPWNAAAAVQDPEDPVIPGDDQSPTNEDQYKNLKAQSWFRVRTRMYKTYRAVMYGEECEHDELISISGDLLLLEQLVRELSQPVMKTGTDGKTIVDKKPEGSRSPNLADAFVGMYNPVRELSILDVLN